MWTVPGDLFLVQKGNDQQKDAEIRRETSDRSGRDKEMS